MGEIIRVHFSNIVPIELGFYPRYIENFVETIEENRPILPIPVLKLRNGKYGHVDGRHRLLFQKIKGLETVELFLAKNPTDIMLPADFPNFPEVDKWHLEETNEHLHHRFLKVYRIGSSRKSPLNDYISYFDYLVKKHPFIKNIRSFKEALSTMTTQTKYDLHD